MSLAALIRERADEVLRTHRDGAHPLVEAQRFIAAHPDEIEDEQARLILKRVAQMFRDAFKDAAGSSQESFEGFGDLPRAFTFPDGEGGYKYVGVQHATIAHWRADNQIKRDNRDAVQTELDKSNTFGVLLLSAPGVDDDTPILEAIRRLS